MANPLPRAQQADQAAQAALREAQERLYHGLACPSCASQHTRVKDTENVSAGRIIRRRRECYDCGHRFTSYEKTRAA